jgi:hypothetical protein
LPVVTLGNLQMQNLLQLNIQTRTHAHAHTHTHKHTHTHTYIYFNFCSIKCGSSDQLYPHNKHNTLNNIHLFNFYNMFRQILSINIRQNHNNKPKSVLKCIIYCIFYSQTGYRGQYDARALNSGQIWLKQTVRIFNT